LIVAGGGKAAMAYPRWKRGGDACGGEVIARELDDRAAQEALFRVDNKVFHCRMVKLTPDIADETLGPGWG
jgi:hypothetical protein